MMTETLSTHPSANKTVQENPGLPWYFLESKRPTSTLPFPGRVQPNTLVDMAMPTSEQWGLLWQLHTIQNTSESDRWPGADWPSEQAFEDARLFIRHLPPVAIRLPNMRLADDGEMNFLWKEDGIHIDLGFYGTGAFSYFARTRDGEKFYGDDVPASQGLPHALVNLVRA